MRLETEETLVGMDMLIRSITEFDGVNFNISDFFIGIFVH